MQCTEHMQKVRAAGAPCEAEGSLPSAVPACRGRGWARGSAGVAVDRADTSVGARWRGQEHGPQPEARVQAALVALMAVVTRREQLAPSGPEREHEGWASRA